MKASIHTIVKTSLKTITIPEEKSWLRASISFVTLVTVLPIGVLSKNFNANFCVCVKS